MKRRSLLFLVLSFSCNVFAEGKNPYIYVLGVAQDAGYPQTGCYEEHCMPGWQDVNKRRGTVALGLIDPASNKKYLFEATPNLPAQLYKLEMEAPSKQFELAGIFLTHAHIGHYAGLMFLGHESMGATGIPVYVMPRMAYYLETNGPWSQLVSYKNIILKPLNNNKEQVFNRLKVSPFLVPHRDEFSETVGYLIKGPTKSAIFIPDIDKWSAWETDIVKLITSVDYALIDATFYADDELPGRDMSKIPHPFVVESVDALESLSREERGKVWFIHMNHTNPLLNSESEESKTVNSLGFNIAVEGVRLEL